MDSSVSIRIPLHFHATGVFQWSASTGLDQQVFRAAVDDIIASKRAQPGKKSKGRPKKGTPEGPDYKGIVRKWEARHAALLYAKSTCM